MYIPLLIFAVVLSGAYFLGPLTRHNRLMGKIILVLTTLLFAFVAWSFWANDINSLGMLVLSISILWALLSGLGARMLILAMESRGKGGNLVISGPLGTGLLISLLPLLTIL